MRGGGERKLGRRAAKKEGREKDEEKRKQKEEGGKGGSEKWKRKIGDEKRDEGMVRGVGGQQMRSRGEEKLRKCVCVGGGLEGKGVK